MDSLKDSLRNNKKTVTMSAAQIDFLNRMHQRTQVMLTQLQEQMAGEYLRMLAVDEFGMDASKDFNFDYHPEKEFENLTISEKIVHQR